MAGLSVEVQWHVHEQAIRHAVHRATAILITLFGDGHGVWVLQHGLNNAWLAITEKGQWIDSDQMYPTHCL